MCLAGRLGFLEHWVRGRKLKELVNVDGRPSAHFNKLALDLLGELLALLGGHLSLRLEIDLVADEDDSWGCYLEDIVVPLLNGLEGLPGSDVVDDDHNGAVPDVDRNLRIRIKKDTNEWNFS